MANVQDFVSELSESGFTKANRYELVFVAPSMKNLMTAGDNTKIQNSLRYRCASVSLPSKSLATTETKIYGPVRKAPYTTTYEDLNISIYLSEDLSERTFFEDWMHYVIDYDTNRVRYFSDYSSSDLKLLTFNEAGQMTHQFEFEGAFPISIGEIQYSYANDEVAQIQIGIAYRKYISTNSKSRENSKKERKQADKIENVLGGAPTGNVGERANNFLGL
tara:strand:- start:4165 stop:4821 length:657 start_codon:yes stop_codon:yes gene_type:complete